ncbi:MAG: glutamate racemase [Candidatus Staskawiczbacteria bacterium]|nr:glutamate racemase [Candidatus Staskawiczbacteria bacterium]
MIGIFDSGVGGLTVVKEIFKYLPEHQIIYFGDTARLPYGTKGADFVKKYSKKITNWLLKRGAKIIIVACNTSSAWAADSLKKDFKKTPIFEMINPAITEALATTKNPSASLRAGKKIGIIGTPGTIRSGVYQKKFLKADSSLEIFSQACPLFVPLVEEGLVDDKITIEIIKKYLEPLKEKGIDTLILGCTHYPLLKTIIEDTIDSGIKVINPAESLAKEVKKYLEENTTTAKKIKRGSKHQFFFSDEPYNLEKISHLCFNKRIKPIVKDPFNV